MMKRIFSSLLISAVLLCSCAPAPAVSQAVSQGQESPPNVSTSEQTVPSTSQPPTSGIISDSVNYNSYYFVDDYYKEICENPFFEWMYLYRDLVSLFEKNQGFVDYETHLKDVGEMVYLEVNQKLPRVRSLDEFDFDSLRSYAYVLRSGRLLWYVEFMKEGSYTLKPTLSADALSQSVWTYPNEESGCVALGDNLYYYYNDGSLYYIYLLKNGLNIRIIPHFIENDANEAYLSDLYHDPSGEGFFTRLLDPKRAQGAADWFLSGEDYPCEQTVVIEERKDYEDWLACAELPKDFLSAEHLKNEGEFRRFYLFQWDEERKYYGYLLEKDGISLLWCVDHRESLDLKSPSLLSELFQARPYRNGIVPEHGLRSLNLDFGDYTHSQPLNGMDGFATYQQGGLSDWDLFIGDPGSPFAFVGNLTALVFKPSNSDYPLYSIFSSELWRYRLNDPSEASLLSRLLEGEILSPQQISEQLGLF